MGHRVNDDLLLIYKQLLGNQHLKQVIYRIANTEVGPDRAETVYHEVRVRIAKFIKGWQGRAAITTWVGAIAKNVCKDVLAEGQRERITITNVLFTEDIAGATDAEQMMTIAAAELLRIIREELLPQIGGRGQQMLEFFLFEELDKQEIRDRIKLKRSFFNQTWRECCEKLLQKIRQLEEYQRQKR